MECVVLPFGKPEKARKLATFCGFVLRCDFPHEKSSHKRSPRSTRGKKTSFAQTFRLTFPEAFSDANTTTVSDCIVSDANATIPEFSRAIFSKLNPYKAIFPRVLFQLRRTDCGQPQKLRRNGKGVRHFF